MVEGTHSGESSAVNLKLQKKEKAKKEEKKKMLSTYTHNVQNSGITFIKNF